ncbi:peptide deformylase [Desulfotomaculum arcticum]|uniref:Peptide deformylase n=1 Tax=Desulfotruncus arcticus DSM 17038 TaxID=1121424 RepID=A0A1I2RAW4_9FIRM|nr:peptide deformylase [Desulfotruncus arcticus]SFG36619.1 peptide deformylase [Desulfotomaculum arcticum] [Desulfotruncus arcticus DSM 17038]
MAVYKIVEAEDDILRDKARLVTKFGKNTERLLDNMKDTMYANKGVGLAAPQIGVSKRVIVVDVGEGPIEFINPEIIDVDGTQTDSEGCLSVPGVLGDVTRALRVEVKGLDRSGNETGVRAEGFLARALQHEIDHLDGILFIDKAKNLRKI